VPSRTPTTQLVIWAAVVIRPKPVVDPIASPSILPPGTVTALPVAVPLVHNLPVNGNTLDAWRKLSCYITHPLRPIVCNSVIRKQIEQYNYRPDCLNRCYRLLDKTIGLNGWVILTRQLTPSIQRIAIDREGYGRGGQQLGGRLRSGGRIDGEAIGSTTGFGLITTAAHITIESVGS